MTSREELTERQRYWLDHVEACERSDQTTKAYCEARGLSTSMMYAWRKDLSKRGVFTRRAPARQASGFDRVAVVGGVRVPASGEWRIVLANGVEVGFSAPVDEATLSRVLGVASQL